MSLTAVILAHNSYIDCPKTSANLAILQNKVASFVHRQVRLCNNTGALVCVQNCLSNALHSSIGQNIKSPARGVGRCPIDHTARQQQRCAGEFVQPHVTLLLRIRKSPLLENQALMLSLPHSTQLAVPVF